MPVREKTAKWARDRRKRRGWTPFDGPQVAAYLACQHVDEVGYGGAAGGGKTDLDLGVAMLLHQRSIIFRRTYPQLAGMIERSRALYTRRGKYREGEHEWRLTRRCDAAGRPCPPVRVLVRFASMQREADREKHRGNPYDLMVFDEAQNFLETQIRFVLAWNRTEKPNQHCGALLTFNPPTDPAGLWLIEYFGPWIDPLHPRPAQDGEVRWYVTTPEGKDEEVDGPGAVERDGRTLTPRSRTFFHAFVQDNPVYMATGYMATLDALPEPLRSQMRDGDFTAGLEDSAWQVIPTNWVKLAMARGKTGARPVDAQGLPRPVTHLGADVAAGGPDRTVFAPRVDDWYLPLLSHSGKQTPDGASAAAKMVDALAGAKGVIPNIDVVGIGQGLSTALTMLGIKFVGVNGAGETYYRDKTGLLTMKNARAEYYWRMRDALDPEGGRQIALPDDRELLQELTAARWSLTPGGVLIEPNEAITARLGRSPDKAVAVMLANHEAQTAGYGENPYSANGGRGTT